MERHLEPVKRVRTVDAVSQRLLSAIVRGEFKPGEKLAPERELAATLKVSRNVLREAVRQLETLGVITVRHGDGMYVTDCVEGNFARPPLESLVLQDTTVLDLIEARQAIEVMSAGLAAQRATLEEHRILTGLVEQMGNAISTPPEYAARDLEFHLAVVRASKNSVLMTLFSAVQDMLKVQLARALDVPGVSECSHDYHQRITAAIIDRDPKLAAAEMEGHLANVTHLLFTDLTRRASVGGTAG